MFAPGLAAAVAQLNKSIVPAPGFAAAMLKVSSPPFSPGLFDSVTKLTTSAMFAPGLAAAVNQLINTGVFARALVELSAQLRADCIDVDSRQVRISREQQRLVCGYFAYVIVWLLVLQIMLVLLGASDTIGKIADITTVMTGISEVIALSIAKNAAYRVYDQVNPPRL